MPLQPVSSCLTLSGSLRYTNWLSLVSELIRNNAALVDAMDASRSALTERPGDRSGILVGDICVIVEDDKQGTPFRVKNEQTNAMAWCRAPQLGAFKEPKKLKLAGWIIGGAS